MAVRIQLRRDTASNWFTNNPVLRPGEIGIETDTLKFKIGPAVNSPAIGTAWNSITAYANVTPSALTSSLTDYILSGDLGNPGGPAKLDANGDLLVPENSIQLWSDVDYDYITTLTATQPTADRTITFKNADGTVAFTSDIPSSTDSLSEGSTNKYFTDERAQDATAAALAAGSHTNITVTYNDNANSISLAAAPGYVDEQAVDAVAAALAAGTHTNISVSYDDNGNAISLTGAVTYTDENAQDAVGNAVGNGLDYDDNTGAISVDPSEFELSAIGAPTTNVSMNSYKITNLASPEASADAATKSYVDNIASGLNFHAAVHFATSTNITTDYNNGTNGLGATLTAMSNGPIGTIDGHQAALNDRVLVKAQTDATQNGIYYVSNVGGASSKWVLTRALDADNSPSGEIAYGDFCFVQNGTLAGGYGYIVTTTGTITIGTTNINYTQFNAGQSVVAGNGLSEPSVGTLTIDTSITADLSTAQTFTNKTLTSPKINEDVAVTATATELNYVDGVTSSIQTQLDAKIAKSLVDAKGDLLVGSADNTVARLGIGTNGYLLTANSSATNGLEWAAAPISLPDQAGNSGEYLTTDGTNASWAAIPVTSAASPSTAGTVFGLTSSSSDNTALGYGPLTNRTTGDYNTGIGKNALLGLTSGYANTALGLGALKANTTGSDNTALGLEALWSNVGGQGNIAVGRNAMQLNTSGSSNVVMGYQTLYRNTVGNNNTVIGNQAGGYITGSQNTILGSVAAYTGTNDLTSGSNNILLGYQAAASAAGVSNEITIGNSSITRLRIPGLGLDYGNSTTISANTATIVDTIALSAFTSAEYMVSIKQGSKVRTSKVIMQDDGTTVDMTEFAITETGGTISGVVVSATASSGNALLQVTITDAATTNATVKFTKVTL